MQRVTPRLRAPIVLFTYYNPIMKRGVEKFVQDAKAAGAAGERSSLIKFFLKSYTVKFIPDSNRKGVFMGLDTVKAVCGE